MIAKYSLIKVSCILLLNLVQIKKKLRMSPKKRLFGLIMIKIE